jgi:hypothetical protein
MKGKYQFRNMDTYEGTFENGMKNGYGVYRYYQTG